MNIPNTEPTVPGATGEYPVYMPVDISLCSCMRDIVVLSFV